MEFDEEDLCSLSSEMAEFPTKIGANGAFIVDGKIKLCIAICLTSNSRLANWLAKSSKLCDMAQMKKKQSNQTKLRK